jgi:hypothetical protein
MNIKSIEKNNDFIIVTVEVPSVQETKGKRILVTTEDVEKALNKQAVKFVECVESAQLWNTNPEQLSAQWKFLVPKKAVRKTKTKKTPLPSSQVKKEE